MPSGWCYELPLKRGKPDENISAASMQEKGNMRWLDALFRKQVLDAQLDKEIEFHLCELTRDNIAAGLDPTEARRRAIIAFGGLDQVKEECREARGLVWFESVFQDLRFGARSLFKDRGYTLTAIIALAIGISANTALFSLFNS